MPLVLSPVPFAAFACAFAPYPPTSLPRICLFVPYKQESQKFFCH